MNLPIDTCENGACAFAIRGEYDKRVYAKNLGLGGGHYPATSVCVVYQLRGRMLPDIHTAMPWWLDFGQHLLFHADKAGSAGGLRAMTLFSIFALRGRDRDNPSLRGRSTENYEQRMELIGGGQTCTITSVQKDNLVLEIYNCDKKKDGRNNEV